LEQLTQSCKLQLSLLNSQHSSQLQSQQNAFSSQLSALQLQLERLTLQIAPLSAKELVDQIHKDYGRKLERAELSKERTIQKLIEDHNRELETLLQDHLSQMRELNDIHTESLGRCRPDTDSSVSRVVQKKEVVAWSPSATLLELKGCISKEIETHIASIETEFQKLLAN